MTNQIPPGVPVTEPPRATIPAVPAVAAPAARPAGILDDVRDGLARAQKELPPKYFYDQRGSELFEEITRLDEYYLTRAERALLAQWMPEVLGAIRAATLVELGAGSAEKTRLVIEAMRAARSSGAPDEVAAATARGVYVPVDVSAEFLELTAARLRADYPGLRVVPVVADIGEPIALPRDLPHPVLLAFLGSTIGNFDAPEAGALLRRARALLGPTDRLLLGADLRKDPAVLEAAYNDARGVTAEFNRNVLRVVNRELGADFVPEAFAHRAFYDRDRHRIEMHLVASRPMAVHIPRLGVVEFDVGETVRTEISCKYDRPTLDAMLHAAGMRVERWITDDRGWYALVVAAPAVADPGLAETEWHGSRDGVEAAGR